MNLEGQQFNRLTVTKDLGKRCICSCSCGATGVVRTRAGLLNSTRESMCKKCDKARNRDRQPKVIFLGEEAFKATLEEATRGS